MNNAHKQIPGPVDYIERNMMHTNKCSSTLVLSLFALSSLVCNITLRTCTMSSCTHFGDPKWQSKASSISGCASNLLRFNEWKFCFYFRRKLKLNLNGAYVCTCSNRLIHQHLLEFPWNAGQTYWRKCLEEINNEFLLRAVPSNWSAWYKPSTNTFTYLLTVPVGHNVWWCIVNLACFGERDEQCHTRLQ